MNTMNNYDYIEGIEFNGLIPAIMEQEGVKTIGNELEVIDFVGTAFGDKEDNENNEGGDDDTHEYVDLGLPSGTLWATENIKDENGNDLYFAWGETSGYTSGQVGTDKYFAWEGEHADYEFGEYVALEPDYGMTKYNSDGITTLETSDDAAYANWGSDWRMPTKDEFDELLENTTSSWTEANGVSGLLLTSTVEGYEEESLFFPAVGSAGDGGVYDVGEYGYCWPASLAYEGAYNAYKLYFDSGYCGVNGGRRCYGYPVRPVRL